MNFEELQLVWNSQNQEPLYVVNEARLHTLVRKRKDEELRRTAFRHGLETVVNATFGVVMLALGVLLLWGDPAWFENSRWVRGPVAPWHAAAAFGAGLAWLFCAAYMWGIRRRQMRREEHFALTVQGDLDRALAHLDFQIHIARRIVWWGLIPAWFAAGLFSWVLLHLRNIPAWGYWVMALMMGVTFVVILGWQFYAIRWIYRPRQRELEVLRTKLTNPEA
jgi:hypothetical protein